MPIDSGPQLKIKLCTPGACYTLFFEEWQDDDNIEAAILARIERDQGITLEPYERHAIRDKIRRARKETQHEN